MMGNKAYHANRQLVNSSLVSRNSKLQIYRTWVRPVVTCGSELWTLTVEEEGALAAFERKILRKMYGAVKENELWRIRQNSELEAIIKGGEQCQVYKMPKNTMAWSYRKNARHRNSKKDVCNKTKRKNKNEMDG